MPNHSEKAGVILFTRMYFRVSGYHNCVFSENLKESCVTIFGVCIIKYILSSIYLY